MNHYSCSLLLLLLLLAEFNIPVSAQKIEDKNQQWKIDSVHIRKNWRTKEVIILQELGIKAGDIVKTDQLETAISKIWNIGNFAKVNYQIDTLKNNRLLLNVTALDALTLMPILSFSGNKEEYLLTVGVNDNNFLGRNIDLALAGSIGTNAHYANIDVGIPRQLLYRNMTLRGGFMFGDVQKYEYKDEVKTSGIAYFQKQVSFSVGNPYHTDYHYTFSPDLSISWFSHKTDTSLMDQGIPMEANYKANYLSVSTGESIGMMNRIRHQKYGYLLSAGFGLGIGLNAESPGYVGIGASGTYAKLLSKVVEIAASFSTGYTTAKLPSLLYYLGPDHVKGILSGERFGKSIYSANAETGITYLNRDWFAIEQSFFANLGNATDVYINLFKTNPLFSVGSRIRFMIPTIPWLGINLYYAWRGDGKHWFSLDF